MTDKAFIHLLKSHYKRYFESGESVGMEVLEFVELFRKDIEDEFIAARKSKIMTENQKNRESALAAKETAIKNGLLKHPVVYLKNCESKLVKEIQKEREATQRARARNVNKWVKKAYREKIKTNDAEN